jgi:hypothetical protein
MINAKNKRDFFNSLTRLDSKDDISNEEGVGLPSFFT